MNLLAQATLPANVETTGGWFPIDIALFVVGGALAMACAMYGLKLRTAVLPSTTQSTAEVVLEVVSVIFIGALFGGAIAFAAIRYYSLVTREYMYLVGVFCGFGGVPFAMVFVRLIVFARERLFAYGSSVIAAKLPVAEPKE